MKIIIAAFFMTVALTPLCFGQDLDLCRASGHAVLQKDATKTEEEWKEVAERTAWIVAIRNLGEQIEGVRVDGRSTVHDYAVSNDRVRTKIRAMVQGARIAGTKYLRDGTVEVVVETDCAKIVETIRSAK